MTNQEKLRELGSLEDKVKETREKIWGILWTKGLINSILILISNVFNDENNKTSYTKEEEKEAIKLERKLSLKLVDLLEELLEKLNTIDVSEKNDYQNIIDVEKKSLELEKLIEKAKKYALISVGFEIIELIPIIWEYLGAIWIPTDAYNYATQLKVNKKYKELESSHSNWKHQNEIEKITIWNSELYIEIIDTILMLAKFTKLRFIPIKISYTLSVLVSSIELCISYKNYDKLWKMQKNTDKIQYSNVENVRDLCSFITKELQK